MSRFLFSLPDPLQQETSALVADQVGEGAGEVAGPGDVRAGEPDLEEVLVAVGEGLARPHDPGGDLAGLGMSARTGSAVPARRAARCSRTTWRLPQWPRAWISRSSRVPLTWPCASVKRAFGYALNGSSTQLGLRSQAEASN
ncbi:hypothetical protein [Streptomyces sp. NPDC048277]|uniref:hypothetical protein n=1 Tax=Streptomyces sp. NPDC048277 TaxID=3155027 RepID=UPI0033D7092E